jgi:hypothetical protein
MAPTMKYWKTMLELVLLLLRYLLKSGILVVGLLPMPLKGESKDEDEVSVGWHLLDEVESARTGSDGSDERGSARSTEREADERAAMVCAAGRGVGVGNWGRWRWDGRWKLEAP